MVIDFEQIHNDVSEMHQFVQSLKDQLNRPVTGSATIDKVTSVSQTVFQSSLSKATVYRVDYKRRVPFHEPIGSRRLYFMRSEVMEWLHNGRKLTTEELTLQDSQSIIARINQRTSTNLTNRKGGRVSHD